MSKMNQKKPQKKGINIAAILILAIVIAIIVIVFVNKSFTTNKNSGALGSSTQGETVQNSNGDILIPVKEITSTATFYKADVDGTELEVLAIQAPDGTVRTAFNTCQVCFDSGRGYYIQEGDVLVCQNCGNRFRASDVELVRGGCNPIPISSEEKVVDADTITISYDFLKTAKGIFENWKLN